MDVSVGNCWQILTKKLRGRRPEIDASVGDCRHPLKKVVSCCRRRCWLLLLFLLLLRWLLLLVLHWLL